MMPGPCGGGDGGDCRWPKTLPGAPLPTAARARAELRRGAGRAAGEEGRPVTWAPPTLPTCCRPRPALRRKNKKGRGRGRPWPGRPPPPRPRRRRVCRAAAPAGQGLVRKSRPRPTPTGTHAAARTPTAALRPGPWHGAPSFASRSSAASSAGPRQRFFRQDQCWPCFCLANDGDDASILHTSTAGKVWKEGHSGECNVTSPRLPVSRWSRVRSQSGDCSPVSLEKVAVLKGGLCGITPRRGPSHHQILTFPSSTIKILGVSQAGVGKCRSCSVLKG